MSICTSVSGKKIVPRPSQRIWAVKSTRANRILFHIFRPIENISFLAAIETGTSTFAGLMPELSTD